MTKINLIAAAILALSAGSALAGEGAGNPFPFSAPNGAVADVPVAVQQMTGQTPLMTKNPPNSVPYGWRDMTSAMRQYATAPVMEGNVLPTNGSQGAVQTPTRCRPASRPALLRMSRRSPFSATSPNRMPAFRTRATRRSGTRLASALVAERERSSPGARRGVRAGLKMGLWCTGRQCCTESP